MEDLLWGGIIGIITSTLGAIIAVKNYNRTQSKDLIEQVRKETELHMKLDFMTNKLLEGNSENKVQFERINTRLDGHEKRILKIEQKNTQKGE